VQQFVQNAAGCLENLTPVNMVLPVLLLPLLAGDSICENPNRSQPQQKRTADN
jgi:hypothetical protein